MGTWVDGVASKYQSGEIATSDLISPNDLLGDSQTQDGFSFAGASLASLGLKTSEFALEVELLETGVTVEGAIYHNDDSLNSLQRDVQYDPASDINGTVYLAYNVTDTDADLGGDTNTTNTTGTTGNVTEGGGALVELKEPFIIRSITDGEGNSYNAANYESKNQQTYSTEIADIQKELEQVSELRQELEKQRDAAALDDGGGGGGFLNGESPDIGVIAAVVGGAGVLYALFSQEGT
ncbi:hypothetical protein C464_12015 [Halorubrum coriense DSM 10284]|uniref:Envelope protein N-terminal domain-containing protein n=2 Tax=Halorubrum coriense TaxID=64713 RepID=M0EF07_9EURY|nr:hypothetical protein C464_12015 [Halorubrum coriense DSM 10284]